MTAHADLAEVRAALDMAEQATPGPWGVGTGANDAQWIILASGRTPIASLELPGAPGGAQQDSNTAAIVALRNAAPAIAAAVEELERLRTAVDEREGDMHLRIRAGYDKTVADAWRAVVAKRDAEIAALRSQVCRLVSGQEIDGDHLCQHHGADVAALALLSDERAAHAETSRDLDALLTALGAEVTPGGQTMDACEARRVADGMRRARELVAACEVPADVEAAIRAAIDGAVASGEARALGHASLLTGEPFYTEPRLRAAIAKAIADAEERGRADSAAAPHDVEAAISDLVEASRDLEVYAEGKVTAKRTRSAERSFGRARTALRASIAAEIDRARAEGRATLAKIADDAPFADPDGIAERIKALIGDGGRATGDGATASEADADPASRGPIVVAETRTGSARAILNRAAADLAAIGVECRVSEHRETAVSAMGGPVVVHLGLTATVHDADEVVP